ncbi:MAG: hypothetical protein JJE13_12855 [Thermoleophilia bacterium]|nr:hypothetical protein [Thermoleophilia bacterium]
MALIALIAPVLAASSAQASVFKYEKPSLSAAKPGFSIRIHVDGRRITSFSFATKVFCGDSGRSYGEGGGYTLFHTKLTGSDRFQYVSRERGGALRLTGHRSASVIKGRLSLRYRDQFEWCSTGRSVDDSWLKYRAVKQR